MGQPWHDYWQETPDNPYLKVEAEYLAGNIVARFRLSGVERVVDFGCGYGYVAEALARHCGEVILWDSVASVMKNAETRIGLPNVRSVERVDLDQLEKTDLIVVNSVIQYMDNEELSSWMARWESMLASDGDILISDVADPDPSILFEAGEWFKLTLRAGMLIDAMRFAVTNSRRYRSTAKRTALNTLSERELVKLASSCGMRLAKEPANLAYQPRRSSYVLTREEL